MHSRSFSDGAATIFGHRSNTRFAAACTFVSAGKGWASKAVA
jgi:hypothetical protein